MHYVNRFMATAIQGHASLGILSFTGIETTSNGKETKKT